MKDLIQTITEYKKLKLDTVYNYTKFNDFAITAHSTQIEGSTLTKRETALLLDEGITPKGKPLEHSLMVRDHYNALIYTKNIAKRPLFFSSDLIKQINAEVMRTTGNTINTVFGTVDVGKGEFRKGAVYAGERYFPDYNKVPGLVDELCKQGNLRSKSIKSMEEAIKLSYDMHYNLVSIHPFYDGNGRTSRLLMSLVQEHFSIPLGVVYKEDKMEYIEALESVRKTGLYDAYYAFMSSQHQKYLQEEISLFKEQQKNNRGNGMFFSF